MYAVLCEKNKNQNKTKKINKKKQQNQYEFLDLSDVDDDERTRLSTALQPQPYHAPASLNVDDAAAAPIHSSQCHLSNLSVVNRAWHPVPYGKLDNSLIFYSFFSLNNTGLHTYLFKYI